MQVQNQMQQISEEEFLLPLSEDEQNSIQGGAFFIPLAIGVAARAAAPYIVRGAAAAGRGIARAAKSEKTKNGAKKVAEIVGGGVAGNWVYDRLTD